MNNLLLFDELREPEKKHADALPPDPIASPARTRALFDGLGASYGEFECFRCAGDSFEAMQADRGFWMLWCCLCGARQWEPAPERDEFVLPEGRFKGCTLDNAATQEGGRDYITFMAAKSKIKRVREKCQEWLDSRRSGS